MLSLLLFVVWNNRFISIKIIHRVLHSRLLFSCFERFGPESQSFLDRLVFLDPLLLHLPRSFRFMLVSRQFHQTSALGCLDEIHAQFRLRRSRRHLRNRRFEQKLDRVAPGDDVAQGAVLEFEFGQQLLGLDALHVVLQSVVEQIRDLRDELVALQAVAEDDRDGARRVDLDVVEVRLRAEDRSQVAERDARADGVCRRVQGVRARALQQEARGDARGREQALRGARGARGVDGAEQQAQDLQVVGVPSARFLIDGVE